MRQLIRLLLIAFVAICSFNARNAALAQDKSPSVETFAIPDSDDGLPGSGPIRRYEWFKDLWQQRRTQWAAQAAEDRGAVVFLGDSITQGWGEDLGGVFGEMPVANRGISGDTTRGMLVRLEQDVLQLDPSGVVMLMGTNDLEEGATPEVVAANIQEIVAALKAHDSKLPIILCQVFPSSVSKSRPAAKIKQINRLLADAFKQDMQVTILDTFTLFADEQGNAKPKEFPDLLHPNEAGYRKWAAALRPLLATARLLETEPDTFQMEPGFESLFNGRDLTGWCLLPTTEQQKAAVARWQANNPQAPSWPIVEERLELSGKSSTPDGRYQAINGRLVVTTPAEGRRIQQLWTTREFPENFILKLEFRATPNADSGVFLREPQLQCRDYALAGPYKNLAGYKPQDWNELVITVRDQLAHCTCNGEVIEAEFKLPPTGPIGLEGDRGQMEYRRLRIAVSP